MMSNRGLFRRNRALNPKIMRAALPSLVALGVGLCGCSINGLRLPFTQAKAAPTRPSPYAPVPLGPPSPPLPPENTTKYGDSVDRVVASVDGNPITNFDIENPGANGSNSLAGNSVAGMDPNSALKQLIAQQLIEQEAQKYADRVDEGEVDRFIQQIEDQNHLSDAQLRAQLQAQGTSYEAFRKNAFKQVETMEMVQREVRAKIQVPESEVEAYYKDHPDEFTVNQEKYRLAQILIAVPAGAPPDKIAAAQKKATGVRQLAIKGKDFADLARQYSEDDSKTKGGELGEFNPNDLNDAIATAIKQTKPGDIAPLVRTRYGFHIIKVEEHQGAGEQPLAAVRDQIHDKLVSERSKDKFEQWVDQDLARQHDIETVN